MLVSEPEKKALHTRRNSRIPNSVLKEMSSNVVFQLFSYIDTANSVRVTDMCQVPRFLLKCIKAIPVITMGKLSHCPILIPKDKSPRKLSGSLVNSTMKRKLP